MKKTLQLVYRRSLPSITIRMFESICNCINVLILRKTIRIMCFSNLHVLLNTSMKLSLQSKQNSVIEAQCVRK